MTYCIAGGQSFNMVLSHRDKGDPALFGMEEDIIGDMRKEFQGWDSQYVNTPDKTGSFLPPSRCLLMHVFPFFPSPKLFE